ncbi:MAG: hypothetical protein MKZ84_04770 [Dehalococcoidia bacterium]|nr:hypothetical protein [Dehalococcoidia bacterium]|tara:strand:+ start:1866 stop:2234 length:369 start_codon:yes stop_codon:yes gene_type:complete
MSLTSTFSKKLLYIQRVLYIYVYRRWNQYLELIKARQYTNVEEKDYLDEAIADLSNVGWVLAVRSANSANLTHFDPSNTGNDELNLLVEVIDNELALSGTGAKEAEEALRRLRWEKSLTTGK